MCGPLHTHVCDEFSFVSTSMGEWIELMQRSVPELCSDESFPSERPPK